MWPHSSRPCVYVCLSVCLSVAVYPILLSSSSISQTPPDRAVCIAVTMLSVLFENLFLTLANLDLRSVSRDPCKSFTSYIKFCLVIHPILEFCTALDFPHSQTSTCPFSIPSVFVRLFKLFLVSSFSILGSLTFKLTKSTSKKHECTEKYLI